MSTIRCRTILLGLLAVHFGMDARLAQADDESAQLPTVKFFFYDSARLEWVTSAEPDRLEKHLAENTTSTSLFQTLSASVNEPREIAETRLRMTRWIEQQRQQFNGYNPDQFRTAEGIVAYLRAHDFSISNLVQALRKRSDASDVELVGLHLVDDAGQSSFHLKVILVNHGVDHDRQGFNVRLRSETVAYTSVIYALGVALYELHEIINADLPEPSSDEGIEVQELPIPEPDTPGAVSLGG